MPRISIAANCWRGLAALALLAALASSPAEALAAGGRLEGISVTDAPIAMVVQQIEEQTGDRVVIKGAITQQRVRLFAENKTTQEVLEQLANSYGWFWWQVPDTGVYELMDKDTYEKSVLVQRVFRKVFRPRNRPAEEIAQALEGAKTPNIGSVTADSLTNTVVVLDLPERVAFMQRIVEDLDSPLYRHVFQIHNAKIEDVVAQIEPLKSEKGTVQPDTRTHTIFVTDLFENIKRMELVVMALDKQTEIRVYNVNNIGLDGKRFDELVDAIKEVVTDEANIKANSETGSIYVEDIPEVHDRIERLMKVFDQPTKQILLQAEIIDVSLDRALSLGVDWEFSKSEETLFNIGKSIFSDTSTGLLNGNGTGAGTGNGQNTGGTGTGTGTSTSIGFVDLKNSSPFLTLGGSGAKFFSVGEHYAAQLTALLKDGDTKVLLKPRILVKNQEEGTFQVTSNDPIIQTYVQPTNYGSNQPSSYSGSSVSQTTVTTGLELTFTPSISNSGLIELQLYLSNSSPIFKNLLVNGNLNSAVGSNEQKAETVLVIPSGETRVIGGFINQQNDQSENGVPYLRQIPVLGLLFGSTEVTKKDRTMLFFLTPTIIIEQPRGEFLANAEKAYSKLVGKRGEWWEEGPGAPASAPAASVSADNEVSPAMPIYEEAGTPAELDKAASMAAPPATIAPPPGILPPASMAPPAGEIPPPIMTPPAGMPAPSRAILPTPKAPPAGVPTPSRTVPFSKAPSVGAVPLPGAPPPPGLAPPASAPVSLPFAGAQGLDETGPFTKSTVPLATPAAVPSGANVSKVELTDAPPPTNLGGSASERALGSRPVAAPKTNYKVSLVPSAAGGEGAPPAPPVAGAPPVPQITGAKPKFTPSKGATPTPAPKAATAKPTPTPKTTPTPAATAKPYEPTQGPSVRSSKHSFAK